MSYADIFVTNDQEAILGRDNAAPAVLVVVIYVDDGVIVVLTARRTNQFATRRVNRRSHIENIIWYNIHVCTE